MAGSSDCIMSLSRWQKLIAKITPNTVRSARGLPESAMAIDWTLMGSPAGERFRPVVSVPHSDMGHSSLSLGHS